MIIRILSRKSAPCPTCGGNTSVQEDEDGLQLKCLMCSRSVEIRRRSAAPASNTNPTFRPNPPKSSEVPTDAHLPDHRRLLQRQPRPPPQPRGRLRRALETRRLAGHLAGLLHPGDGRGLHRAPGPARSGFLPTGDTFTAIGKGENPVLVLGVFPADEDAGPYDVYYHGLDALLEDWAQRCPQPNGLAWVIRRLETHRETPAQLSAPEPAGPEQPPTETEWSRRPQHGPTS